jgi:hypothetical protein
VVSSIFFVLIAAIPPNFATMALTAESVAICIVLLCGVIAPDVHAQAAVHRFGAPIQRRFPPTTTAPQSPA